MSAVASSYRSPRSTRSRVLSWVLTEEVADKSSEIFDYASGKPAVPRHGSSEIKLASKGKSLGNVRAMHNATVAGKFTEYRLRRRRPTAPPLGVHRRATRGIGGRRQAQSASAILPRNRPRIKRRAADLVLAKDNSRFKS
jgi:hypothetical protein